MRSTVAPVTSATVSDSDSSPRSSRWILPAGALIGLLVAILIFSVRTPVYEAEALVAVSNPSALLDDEAAFVTNPLVLDAATSILGYQPDITVTAATTAGVLQINARAIDPESAALAANTVAQTYVQASSSSANTLASQATPPTSATGLPATVWAVIGTLLGALVGMIAAFFVSAGQPTSRRPPARPRPSHAGAVRAGQADGTIGVTGPDFFDMDLPEPVASPRTAGVIDLRSSAAAEPRSQGVLLPTIDEEMVIDLTEDNTPEPTPGSEPSSGETLPTPTTPIVAPPRARDLAEEGLATEHDSADPSVLAADADHASFYDIETEGDYTSTNGATAPGNLDTGVGPSGTLASTFNTGFMAQDDSVTSRFGASADDGGMWRRDPAETVRVKPPATPPSERRASAESAPSLDQTSGADQTPGAEQAQPVVQPEVSQPLKRRSFRDKALARRRSRTAVPSKPPAEPAARQPTAQNPVRQSDPNQIETPAATMADSTADPVTTPSPEPQHQARPMTAHSFSTAAARPDDEEAPDAASPETFQRAWLDGGSAPSDLLELERRTAQARFDAARYELELAHDQRVAALDAAHERETAEFRAEIGQLNKQNRMQAARLKNRSGADQTRVGDLEAQIDALEVELVTVLETLEGERIGATHRLTEERGVADRALDNARRQYREELAKHVHSHRTAMGEHRADLDRELAEDRAQHAEALETQHIGYEEQLETERKRAEATLVAASKRYEREISQLRQQMAEQLDKQATQHKDTIAQLRTAGQDSDSQLRDLQKENRLFRNEISSLQKQARQAKAENGSTVQRLSDETAILRGELDNERERNVALRADVLRRSAESHQAIDQAVEERTAQLAELEASVARQREYADSRVREMSSAAEEAARQSATREANLTATVSRLKRELEEAKRSLPIEQG